MGAKAGEQSYYAYLMCENETLGSPSVLLNGKGQKSRAESRPGEEPVNQKFITAIFSRAWSRSGNQCSNACTKTYHSFGMRSAASSRHFSRNLPARPYTIHWLPRQGLYIRQNRCSNLPGTNRPPTRQRCQPYQSRRIGWRRSDSFRLAWFHRQEN